MIKVVKSLRHIHVQQIFKSKPSLFQAIITYEPHPYKHAESGELEHQKVFVNKLIEDKWFVKQSACSSKEVSAYPKPDYF